MIRKKAKRKFLAESPFLITDHKYESEYFKVSDFPSELHAGKNMFRLRGNAFLLEKNYPIEIEIWPEGGSRPIYHEVNKYRDDAGRRIITIYVYPEDLTGLATVTITGVAKRRPGGRGMPRNWRGKRNVRWQREIYVDPQKPNTSPIIFNNQPRITIDENVKAFLSESYGTDPNFTTIDYIGSDGPQLTYNATYPTSPAGGQAMSGKSANSGPQTYSNTFTLNSSGLIFSSSAVGGTIYFPSSITTSMTPALSNPPTSIPTFKQNGQPNSTEFTASIIQVVNSSTLKLDKAFDFDYTYTSAGQTSKGSNFSSPPQSVYANHSPSSFTTTRYKIEYTGDPITYTENTMNLHSYANIILANIDPMVGDVYRCKIWMKSHGIQTWDVLADEVIEGVELMTDVSNVYKLKRTGVFGNQTDVDNYFGATAVTTDASFTPATPILKADSEALMEGMILSGSLTFSASSARDTDYVKFFGKKPVNVYKGNEYTIAFKTVCYGEEDDDRNFADIGNPEMRVYISGSGVSYDPVGSPEMGRRMDSGELKASAPPQPSQVSSGMFNKFNNSQNVSYAFQSGPAGLGSKSTVATSTPLGAGYVPDIGDGAVPLFDEDYTVFSFTADHDGQVVPVFQVKFGKWVISDIQLRCATEGGFTPNHTIIEARVPEYQEDDVLDFKFEFFDYNGVRSDLIMVKESVSFEGGNTYIASEGYLGEGIIFDGEIG